MLNLKWMVLVLAYESSRKKLDLLVHYTKYKRHIDKRCLFQVPSPLNLFISTILLYYLFLFLYKIALLVAASRYVISLCQRASHFLTCSLIFFLLGSVTLPSCTLFMRFTYELEVIFQNFIYVHSYVTLIPYL